MKYSVVLIHHLGDIEYDYFRMIFSFQPMLCGISSLESVAVRQEYRLYVSLSWSQCRVYLPSPYVFGGSMVGVPPWALLLPLLHLPALLIIACGNTEQRHRFFNRNRTCLLNCYFFVGSYCLWHVNCLSKCKLFKVKEWKQEDRS